MKRTATLLLTALLALCLLAACGDERHDTRKYITTIGAVFTNDMDVVFRELYVYPGDISDMGEDFIKNAYGDIHVGSYGVTVEVSEKYNVWLKDRDGGSYTFSAVPLENADLAVITFDGELLLTISHRSGETDVVQGRYVSGGDAPDHPQEPLKEEETFKFNFHNETGAELKLIAMREADNQARGQVELYIEPLKDGKFATISGKLDENDFGITEWVVHLETADGAAYTGKDVFNPWTAEKLTATVESGALKIAVEEKG